MDIRIDAVREIGEREIRIFSLEECFIILGDGDGANVAAVDSEGKLATTWGELKR